MVPHMFPLLSMLCLLLGTFILLTRALLFGVGVIIARHQVAPADDR